MGRIFVGGDTHGDMQKVYNISNLNKMSKNDYYIICGDFGFIWNGEWRKHMTKIQRACPATILFIDGNHENFDLLETMPIEERFGAPVHVCGDRVFHLMRGNVYTIEGHTFFTFGGARSSDKMYREPGKSWWYREEPSLTELNEGQKNLYHNLDTVEYVLTHDCPDMVYHQFDKWRAFADGLRSNCDLLNYFNKWFEVMFYDAKNFKCWYSGHHHIDVNFTDLKASLLYEVVEVIE